MPEATRDQVQRKAFINFINTLVEEKIDSLEQLTDGIVFVKCLEKLTQKPFSYSKTCRNIFQKLENVNVTLKYLENECGVKLVNIDANMITKQNDKIILALIWHIILFFKISKAFSKEGSGQKSGKDDSSASKDMMDWINQQLESNGQAQNFTEDWKNGLRLKNLIKQLRESVDPNVDKKLVGNTAVELNNSCIAYAEEEMKIPKLLSGEDIAEFPDKLAMMTYLSYFREYEQIKAEEPPPVTPDPSVPHTCELSDSLKEELEKMRAEMEKLKEENGRLKEEQVKQNEVQASLRKELEQSQQSVETLQEKDKRNAALLKNQLELVKRTIEEVEKQKNVQQLHDEIDRLRKEKEQQLLGAQNQLQKAKGIIEQQDKMISELAFKLSEIKTNYRSRMEQLDVPIAANGHK